RFDALGDLPDAFKVRSINAFGTSQRQPHAVQRDRRIAPDCLEIADRGSATHIVLGVNFHPPDLGPRVEYGLMMLKTQPDPGLRRNRVGSADVRGLISIFALKSRWSCRPESWRSRRPATARMISCRGPASPAPHRN